jgi:hypothetical protein
MPGNTVPPTDVRGIPSSYDIGHPADSQTSSSSGAASTATQYHDERFPQSFQRARTNSAPTTRDPHFAGPYRSVRTQGILAQSDMRARGMEYHASNDGNTVKRTDVDVTRLPGDRDGQRNYMEMEANARAAVENHAHGALSVALERGGNEPLATEFKSPPLTAEQRKELPELMKYTGLSLEDAEKLVTKHQKVEVLSNSGQHQASQRMHSTFMVTADSNEAALHESAYETTRPSIPPSQFTSVQVPSGYGRISRQVDRELAARGGPVYPPSQYAPDVAGLQPHYQRPNGSTLQVTGVRAPAYHSGIQQQTLSGRDTDVHIVRTGLPAQDEDSVEQPRRSNSL